MLQNQIKTYFDETIKLINTISISLKDKQVDLYKGIEESCLLVRSVADKDKKVMFIGNGGSAAIASHMAIDFWKNGRIKAMAFNDGALLTCLGNDYGYEHVFEKPIATFADSGDLLIAISSSGNSPNILNGVKAAKEKECKVITLSGFKPDNRLFAIGDINFHVPSLEYGPVEVLHQFVCHYILDVLSKERL